MAYEESALAAVSIHDRRKLRTPPGPQCQRGVEQNRVSAMTSAAPFAIARRKALEVLGRNRPRDLDVEPQRARGGRVAAVDASELGRNRVGVAQHGSREVLGQLFRMYTSSR